MKREKEIHIPEDKNKPDLTHSLKPLAPQLPPQPPKPEPTDDKNDK